MLPQNIRLGIGLIIIAAFLISVQDVTFKLFVAHLPIWQLFAVRGMLILPALLALIMILQRGRLNLPELAAGFAPWPLLRAFTFSLTLLAFYAALVHLTFATVGAANYTAPLFVAILTAVVVGERVGAMGWLAIFMGFVGLSLLLKPGTDAFSPWVLLPVAGAMCYAVTHVITRVKCQHLRPTTLSFSQNTVMMLSGFVGAGALLVWPPGAALIESNPELFAPWPQLSGREWLILGFMGALTIAASTLIAAAYKSAPTPTVATFEYSYLLFAAFWTALLDIPPDALGFLGIALIVLAGLLILRKASPSGDSMSS